MSGFPGSGKTAIASYLEQELGFARVDWDRHCKESERPGPAPELKQVVTEFDEGDISCTVISYEGGGGYDYRDEAWKRLLCERDGYLQSGRDVVIDGLVNDFWSRERVYKTRLVAEKALVVVEVGFLRHWRNLKKRCPDELVTWDTVDAVRAAASDWFSIPNETSDLKVLRYQNDYFWSLWSIRRDLKKQFRMIQK